MKNRKKQLIICLTAVSVLACSLSGCGKRKDELTRVTETETEAVTEKVTERVTEKAKESETQKLITSVDYTSKDGTVKITLPDNTWKVTQDADEMRVFSSGNAAMINITHASTEAAMNNLNVMTTEENLKASLTKQYSDSNAYEVESFENAVISGINTYRYVVKYNATARMWAYAVTYGIVAEDQAYVISGTVTDENDTLLKSVEKSVDSFRVLKDEVLKSVTSNVISGTTQKTPGTTATTGSTSAEELKSLTDYGTDAALYANDAVNVRLAPGTDADIMATVNTGDKITVVGETSGWFKVSISGNIGYIRKDFLVNSPVTQQTETNASSSAGAAAAEINTQTTYGSAVTLYASSAVNVRSQPGTDSSVIDGYSTGNAVTVIGETDNWFVVSVTGNTGYVSKAYLTYDSSVGNNANTGNENNNANNSGNSTGGNTGGNTGTGTGSGTISGTVISSGMDYITVAGDDGANHTIYYGDASTSTVDGLYDGVYVSVTVDNSQTAADGTLYATSVTGQ